MSLGLLDILCILLLLAGLIFFLGASVGLLRFPDFYTRMHAAGKGDTLSTLMIMAGAAVYELNRFDPSEAGAISAVLIAIKIMLIGAFIMITSPTSTHALMQAGYDDEIEPVGERGHDMTIKMPPLGETTQAEPGARATTESSPPPPRAKKTTRKKSAAKKSTAKKKAPAKKTSTKKSAKKVAKKKAAKKTTAKKKSAGKKVAAKKSTAKKTTAKKKAPRRKKD